MGIPGVIGCLAVIANLAELNRELARHFERERLFSVTATVVSVSGHSEERCDSRDQQRMFYVSDGKSYSPLSQSLDERSFPKSGELVRFDGRLVRERFGWNNARIERFHRIGTARVPKPEKMTVADLQNPSNLFRYASMAGTLTDVVRDDIDPENTWLFLRCIDGSFLASAASGRMRDPSFPALGDSIELVGCCMSSPTGGRRHFQPAYLNAFSVRILEKGPRDPFAVPGIDKLDYISPYLLDRLSLRCTDGLVLAALSQNRILLRTPEGRVVGAEMRESRLPSVGEVISVSGFPTTDMFILHLVSAVWRPSATHIAEMPVERTTMRKIMERVPDGGKVFSEYYGRRIRLRGRVVEVKSDDDQTLTLAADGFLVSVQMLGAGLSRSDFSDGSEIEVTGVCVFDTDVWTPRNLMPRIRGVTVFVARHGDIVTLSRPPWWTVRRMLFVAIVVSVVIFAALLIVAIRARVVKTRARLKALERTRLAAEIHDSLSQNLSGVAGQIAAVRRAMAVKPSVAVEYLSRAERMLSSSRTELQRCLFDLRGTALEAADLNDSVRQTVEPLLGTVRLRLRFHVARTLLGDSPVHAVLCIVRELVSNAIVHGQAEFVRIAGTLQGANIRFSVTDNGRGFDPATAPGIAEGHFGLQGVRERLNALGGTIAFSSVRPRGCRATVSIPIREKNHDTHPAG